MPPFDYHPPNTIPAPLVKQATPSALQKQYLKNVDTGPDSLKGARFLNSNVSSAPLPNDAPRAIFTEKLVQHERDSLMPYLRSDKVTGHASSSSSSSSNDKKEAETTSSGADDGAKRRRTSSSSPFSPEEEALSTSAGTNAQLNANDDSPYFHLPLPAAAADVPSPSSSDAAGKEKEDDDHVKTGIPGLVLDRDPLTTMGNAHWPWITWTAIVFGVAYLLIGAWGAARIVDVGWLILAGIYIFSQLLLQKDGGIASAALTALRDKYRSNPTLWQSALLFVMLLYVVTFALDLSSTAAFALANAAAWTVVASQIVFLAAKHWVHQDLFDLLPKSWFDNAQDDAPASGASSSSSSSAGKEEVFHVAENIYTYGEAAEVCASLDAKLATYDQVEDAYKQGAEFCGMGWSDGQMALFPTQKHTWLKLQQSTDPNKRVACGRPGVNGGHIADPLMKFGVTCFGVKPAATDNDITASATSLLLPGSGGTSSTTPKYTRDQLTLSSFNYSSWSSWGGGGTGNNNVVVIVGGGVKPDHHDYDGDYSNGNHVPITLQLDPVKAKTVADADKVAAASSKEVADTAAKAASDAKAAAETAKSTAINDLTAANTAIREAHTLATVTGQPTPKVAAQTKATTAVASAGVFKTKADAAKAAADTAVIWANNAWYLADVSNASAAASKTAAEAAKVVAEKAVAANANAATNLAATAAVNALVTATSDASAAATKAGLAKTASDTAKSAVTSATSVVNAADKAVTDANAAVVRANLIE